MKEPRYEPSNGVKSLARNLFEASKGEFSAILLEAATACGIDLDNSVDPTKGKSVVELICGCVIHEIDITRDTLQPVIRLEIRSDQAASYVRRKPRATDVPFQASIGKPEALGLVACFRDRLNHQIEFEPIAVYPEVILDTVMTPEEALDLHNLTRAAVALAGAPA